MFQFHHGNDLAHLRDIACELLARDPPPPLQLEHVVLPNVGMAKWLRRGVAERQGIATSLSCDIPAVFLRRIAVTALGLPAGGEDAWSREQLEIRLMGLLPGMLDAPALAPLAQYLADTRDPRRLLALARQLAALFDQYLIWRGDWILSWERGEPGQGDPARDHPWQPLLWQALSRAVTGAQPHALHAAAMVERLCAALDAARPEPGLPARITGFGLGVLPPGLLEVFRRLGRHSEVRIFQFNPCQEFWADVQSERNLARWRLCAPQRALHAESGNPLLASWGRLGATQLGLLLDGNDDIEFHFSERGDQSLLAAIQNDIRQFQSAANRGSLPAGDRSLMFAEAHSRLREIEALHDALLDLCERLPGLAPRDIVVMAPDIEPYVPHIDAVFGELAGNSRYLPYSIADRSDLGADPLARILMHLLALPRSRFSASEVLGLLAVPAVAARAGLDASDADTLRELVARSGIRWGYDANATTGDAPALARNTWRFGLGRLLLGLAMDEGELFQGDAPLGVAGMDEAERVGLLAEFVDRLAERARQLTAPRTPAAWRVDLDALLTDFFSDDAPYRAALAELRAAVSGVFDAFDAASFDAELPREALCELVETALGAAESSHAFLRAGVGFCQLTPLRSIPFRVVCLLGMNAESFPRNRERPGFDLMRVAPRAGDPSRRDDDRFLFLESLMAARDCLYVSRISADERSDAPLEPAVPVSELKEYIDRGWGEGSADSLTVCHRLKPFHPDYFNGQGGLFTYRHEWLPAARAGGAGPLAFCPHPLPAPESASVNPAEFARFFSRPCEAFFISRWDLRFDTTLDALGDHEPLELDNLQIYRLKRDLLEAALAGRDDTAQDWLAATGSLPMGAAGAGLVRRNREGLDKLLVTVGSWGPARSVEVSLTLGSQRIEGVLGGLRGAALREYSVSSTASPRSLVEFWVRHLIACAGAHVAEPSELRDRDKTHQLALLPAAEALQHLQDLAAVRAQGLCEPLPLFPAAALAFACVAEPEAARAAARGRFLPAFAQPGEAEDPYVARAYPDPAQALGPQFEALAGRVFGPLAHALGLTSA